MAIPVKSSARVKAGVTLDAESTGVINATQINGIPLPAGSAASISGLTPATDGVGNAAWSTVPAQAGAIFGDSKGNIGNGAIAEVPVPFNAKITGWTIILDANGACQIAVNKCTYSAYPTMTNIAAAALPAVVGSTRKATSTSIGTWTVALSAGDILQFVVNSCSGAKKITIVLQLVRT